MGVRGELVGGLKVSSLHFEGREEIPCSMTLSVINCPISIFTFARLMKNKKSTHVDLARRKQSAVGVEERRSWKGD